MAQDVTKARSINYNGKSRSQVLENVKEISGLLQHDLVVVDIDKRQ